MLNFKLNPNAINPSSTTPLQDYLHSLGIEEVDEFIHRPTKQNELDGILLDNALNVVHKLRECFEANKKFFLIVDCDTDGFTSSAIFYNYFKSIYPNSNIEWMLHTEKQHGIELDRIPDDREVIIVPDAGSNQAYELDILNSKNKQVIIMDHHQVECNNLNLLTNVLLVNNQISDAFYNKALSGAGVVFKLVQLFDKTFDYNCAYEFYDLAALGIIADCMDSRTLDNNYIIYKGLNNIKNRMFRAIIDKQSYGIGSDKPTKMDVAFYIAPLINGVIRMGTMEDKELLFRGFIEQNHEEMYDHTWRGVTNKEDYYHKAARVAFNVKNEQNRIKMNCMEFLKKRIEAEGLDKNKIIAVIAYDDDEVKIPKTITGLVAMELLKIYNKPALVLRPIADENGDINYIGSGRSNNFEDLPSFLQFVRDQEESVFAQGHACAFGCSIKAEEFDNFIAACNEKMAHINFDNNAVYVDAHFKHKINRQVIYEWASGKHIYGNQIPSPQIVVEGIVTFGSISFMGAQGNSIRFDIDGIPCIKLKDNDLALKLRSGNRFKITVLGEPILNEFRGAVIPQIKIKDIDVIPLNGGGLF